MHFVISLYFMVTALFTFPVTKKIRKMMLLMGDMVSYLVGNYYLLFIPIVIKFTFINEHNISYYLNVLVIYIYQHHQPMKFDCDLAILALINSTLRTILMRMGRLLVMYVFNLTHGRTLQRRYLIVFDIH